MPMAPHSFAHRPVVDERHERRRDLLALLAPEDRRGFRDEVSLEAVPAGLVEQHAAAGALDDDGQPARRSGTGVELEQSQSRRLAGEILDVVAVEQLEADRVTHRLVARLHAGVAARHGGDPKEGLDLVILGEEAVGVRDEDAAPAVRVRGRHLHDRGAFGTGGRVGPLQQLDLDRLRNGLGRGHHLVRPADLAPGEVDHFGAARPAPGRRTRSLGRREQALLGEVGGVRIPGGLTDDDPHARSAVASGAQLLDLAVVERGRRRTAVLGEHLGEVAAAAERRAQHLLQHRLLDHGGPLSRSRYSGLHEWKAARAKPYRTQSDHRTRPLG